MDYELKAQILREIMQAMSKRDGDRIRPKHVEAEVEEHAAPDATAGKGLGVPDEDDMSPDDAQILEQLLAERDGEALDEEKE